ncbi:MAG: type II toxin-antitoxin system VapC family toxin [Terracidiphilus sp.]
MPLTHLLDTNIVSYFVRGNYPAVRVRMSHARLDSLAVSAATEAELLFWVLCRPGSARVRTGVEDFLLRVPSLAWDTGAAESYARLRDALKRRGIVLSTVDLLIAAHAMSLGLTLVTHDRAFSFIDGLKTEDWTAA